MYVNKVGCPKKDQKSDFLSFSQKIIIFNNFDAKNGFSQSFSILEMYTFTYITVKV